MSSARQFIGPIRVSPLRENPSHFYDQQYRGEDYAIGRGNREETAALQAFIERFELRCKHVLEIGCGRAAFQYLVDDWTGIDLAASAGRNCKKPFVAGSANALPFLNESFDAIWSITVLEHIPKPETCLDEIIRVLKPGGAVCLAPAWHCRSWAAGGYHVRPWSDLGWKAKFIKASIPLRDAIWFRAAYTLPLRIWREFLFLWRGRTPIRFFYHTLNANYETYWCADSDACNSMDPHEMLLWFRSRGWDTPSHPTWLSRFLVRHGAIIVQKPHALTNTLKKETGISVKRRYKLAVLASHPIQYQAPLFRALAARPEIDLTVYFCSDRGGREYMDPGFGKMFRWDTAVLDSYQHYFLQNWSWSSIPDRFWGLINPGIVTELIRGRFDAVIIHSYAQAVNWLGYLGAWVSATPVLFRGETVLRENRPWWIRAVKPVLLTILFKGTAAFLTIGSHSREFYEDFKVPSNRMFFTPYTVDNEFFAKESAKWRDQRDKLKPAMGLAELPTILFVGKLIERKRPFDLLYAYEGIQEQAGLVFVGDGALRPALECYAKEHGLSHILFAGFQNQSTLPKYYALADIFVLPSSSGEVSPLVINEAMCCGLPIVASDAIPSSRDFVHHGINGFVYTCGELDELRNILRSLVEDAEMRSSMSERSLEMIANWSIQEVIHGIIKALHAVARVRRG